MEGQAKHLVFFQRNSFYLMISMVRQTAPISFGVQMISKQLHCRQRTQRGQYKVERHKLLFCTDSQNKAMLQVREKTVYNFIKGLEHSLILKTSQINTLH